MIRDFRFAIRLWLAQRRFTALAIAVIALGVGVNAFGFSIINAVYLRPLPFEDPERLRIIAWETAPDRHADASYGEFEAWRTASHAFTDIAAFSPLTVRISVSGGYPREASATALSANAFRLLGLRPAMGRDFSAEDERQGATRVVMLSHDLWTSGYAADRAAIGQMLRVDGVPSTIIGVMPPGIRFPEYSDLWTAMVDPLATEPLEATLVGRLRPDVSAPAAQEELRRIAQRDSRFRPIDARGPASAESPGGGGPRAAVLTFRENYIGGVGPALFGSIMATATFVLLIAVANLATLLLSRTAARGREIALRIAIGATRAQIVRQLLVESVALAAAGSAAGLLLAAGAIRLFAGAMIGVPLPYWIAFTLDGRVVTYVMGIAFVTAALSGLTPAIAAARGIAASRPTRRYSTAIVLSEVVFTVMLLTAAALMGRSMLKLYVVDVGIDTEGLSAMALSLPESIGEDAAARRAFVDRLTDGVGATPGVERATVTTGVPPVDGGERMIEVEGSTLPARFVSSVAVGDGFFALVRRPVLRGRAFEPDDGASALSVIVNEGLAAAFFPDTDPIGRRVRFTSRQPGRQPPSEWHTIVGIAPAIRYGDASDEYRNSTVFLPYREHASADVSLLVRSSLAADAIETVARREAAAIDREQVVGDARSIEQAMADGRRIHVLFGMLFVFLAGIALPLAATGLYGVTAHAVALRTQEFGVRLAVGARRGEIVWMILRGGLQRLAAGAILGMAGGAAVGIVLRDLLVGIDPIDPASLAIVALTIVAVGLLAYAIPAWKAAGINPLAALRAE